MPVLEAMACGLPVIVTGGGPTDEFCPPRPAGGSARACRCPSERVGTSRRSAPRGCSSPCADLVALLRRPRRRPSSAGRGAPGGAAQRFVGRRRRTLRRAPGRAQRQSAAPARARPRRALPAQEDVALRSWPTPAWRADADRLGELLADLVRRDRHASTSACLYLLADPTVAGSRGARGPRRRGRRRPAPTSMPRGINVLMEPHAADRDRSLHAAIDAYVPVHDGCARHVRLAREAGLRRRQRRRARRPARWRLRLAPHRLSAAAADGAECAGTGADGAWVTSGELQPARGVARPRPDSGPARGSLLGRRRIELPGQEHLLAKAEHQSGQRPGAVRRPSARRADSGAAAIEVDEPPPTSSASERDRGQQPLAASPASATADASWVSPIELGPEPGQLHAGHRPGPRMVPGRGPRSRCDCPDRGARCHRPSADALEPSHRRWPLAPTRAAVEVVEADRENRRRRSASRRGVDQLAVCGPPAGVST